MAEGIQVLEFGLEQQGTIGIVNSGGVNWDKVVEVMLSKFNDESVVVVPNMYGHDYYVAS